MKKAICLFAGFDASNKIHDYVFYYLKELSVFADIYYLADCEMPSAELNKLDGVTKGAFSYRHGKYDFGSWQELFIKIGWQEISRYEQLIFANDSCYGPMFPFQEMFIEMQKRNVDFWGVTHSQEIQYHLQSYFLAFNRNVFESAQFHEFLYSIKKEETFNDVVKLYEIGLTQRLLSSGFLAGAYINELGTGNATFYPVKLLRQRIPLIKIKCFIPEFNHFKEWYPLLLKTIKKKTTYDLKMIKRHLISKSIGLIKNYILLSCKHPRLNWIYKRIIKKLV